MTRKSYAPCSLTPRLQANLKVIHKHQATAQPSIPEVVHYMLYVGIFVMGIDYRRRRLPSRRSPSFFCVGVVLEPPSALKLPPFARSCEPLLDPAPLLVFCVSLVLVLVLAAADGVAGGDAGMGVKARLDSEGPSTLSDDSLIRSVPTLATEYDLLYCDCLAVDGDPSGSSDWRGVAGGLPFTRVEFERVTWLCALIRIPPLRCEAPPSIELLCPWPLLTPPKLVWLA